MILKRMGGILAGDGVRVASVTHPHTGLTVVVLPPGATGGAAVRGGAPATREVELLYPENMVPGPDAVLLTGGSAFGLAAADGVVRALGDAGRGFPTGPARVPIVPALALFDLKSSAPEPPTPDDGWGATRQALAQAAPIQEGRGGCGSHRRQADGRRPHAWRARGRHRGGRRCARRGAHGGQRGWQRGGRGGAGAGRPA